MALIERSGFGFAPTLEFLLKSLHLYLFDIHIQDTKLVTVILSVHNFTFLLLAKIFDIVKIDVKVQTLE